MNIAVKSVCAGLSVAMLSLVGTASGQVGRPKLSPNQESAETRFVLFVLDDLMRTTWPDAESVGAGRHVRAFIAQRERIVDDVTHRIRDAGIGGKKSKELIELFDLYMKSVREHGELHAGQLEKLEEAVKKKWLEVYRKVDANAATRRLEAASRVTLTAMDYMSRPDADPLVGLFGTVALGLLEETKIRGEVLQKARAEFAPILEEAKKEYAEQAKVSIDVLVDNVEKDVKEGKKKAKEMTLALAKERKWKAAETPFSGETTVDLFSELRRIDAEQIALDRGPTRESEERIARAKKYVEAVKRIPAASDRAFNFFRAVCYNKAGVEANKAATLAAGTNGFMHNPTTASKLAAQSWLLFIANNDRDVPSAAFHNWALALAYNGDAISAYDTLKKANNSFLPTGAAFYFDTARICSVAAANTEAQFRALPVQFQRQRETVMRQRIQIMLQDASLSMQRAVILGFKDFERAREAPDLQYFRTANEKLFGRYKTFQQIVESR